jgi:hypothetical protein
MISKLISLNKEKPFLGFTMVCLSFALLLILLFGFGAYLNSDLTNTATSVILGLLSLLSLGVALFLELLFFRNNPSVSIRSLKLNRYFLFPACLSISLIISSIPYLVIYLINSDLQLVQSHWFSLIFPFIFLLVSSGVFTGIIFLELPLKEPALASKAGDKADIKQDKVNGFLSFFLCSFYLLVAAQYCFAWNPRINSFFTSTSTKILYRAVIFVYLGVYCLLLAKKNKLSLSWPWALAMGLLIVCNLAVFAFVPTIISYSFEGSNYGANLSINYVTFSIGWYNILIMFLRFLGAVYVFLFLFSFIRPSVRTRKQVIWPMLTVVGLSMIFCIYSLIFERDSYIAFLQGQEVRSQIVSITHSKNALGIFLFAGCFASAFLLKYVRKGKWPFILTFLLNLAIAFVSGCYTAVVPVFLLAVILIISWVVQLIRNPKKKWIGISLSLLAILSLAIVLVCVYTPSIRSQSGVWSRLYNRLSSLGSSEISSRTSLWTTGLSVLNGPFVFFGKPDQVANVEIGIAQTILPGNDLSPEDFHSAFLSFYSSHGLVGLVIYLSVHAWVFAQLIKIHRNNPTLSIYLLILFVGAILFSMPETYTLFISMSASTLPISYLLICDVNFFQHEVDPKPKEPANSSLKEGGATL